MTLVLSEVNYWAVLVGAIFYMGFGALYYSPVLFGNSWTRLNRIQEGHMRNPLIYVGSTAVAFLSSFLIAVLTQTTGSNSLGAGLTLGGIAGLIIACVYLKNAAFGLMSKRVYAIAVGDHLISFIVLGILNGIWP